MIHENTAKSVLIKKVIRLANNKKLNGTKSKKLTAKSCELAYRLKELYHDDKSKVKKTFLGLRAFTYAMRGFSNEKLEIRKKKKIAAGLFSVSKDKIAGDYELFIMSDENVEIYVNDFQYDASVPLRNLTKLRIIWGDVNLQKLHDYKYLNQLSIIIGDVYMSDAINVDGAKNLEIVTGNIYAERLKDIDELKGLSYVGGRIYHEGKILALDEIKR